MKAKKEQAKQLLYERKNFWKEASTEEVKRAFDFAVPYKDFLNKCKTERETVQWTEELLKAVNLNLFLHLNKAKGFTPFSVIKPLQWRY